MFLQINYRRSEAVGVVLHHSYSNVALPAQEPTDDLRSVYVVDEQPPVVSLSIRRPSADSAPSTLLLQKVVVVGRFDSVLSDAILPVPLIQKMFSLSALRTAVFRGKACGSKLTTTLNTLVSKGS